MPFSNIDSDVYVNGSLTAKTMVIPSAAVGDSQVQAAAGIAASKLEHQFEVTYSQDSTTDATVERRVIHIVKGATADLIAFAAGSVSIAVSAGNAVIDLLKNGTTVLSAPITLDSANTNYVLENAAGYTSTDLVAGDVLEFKVTSVNATKPKGVFCRLTIREDAQ